MYLCVRVSTRGKSSAPALGECVCAFSVLSHFIYSFCCVYPLLLRDEVNKMPQQGDGWVNLLKDRATHTHHHPTSHSSPSHPSVSLASGGCVLESQGPKPSGASGVVKAAMCNATQTRSGLRTHHGPGGMLHTSHPEPPTASWEAETENTRSF